MEDNYPKAYKEVHEILKHIPKEDVEKIPQDIIQTIKNNMDCNYEYQVNEQIKFEELPMLRETRAILAILYRDYWATPEQKARIFEKQKNDIERNKK